MNNINSRVFKTCVTVGRYLYHRCGLIKNYKRLWGGGATDNAKPDIARPSKLWGLTLRDWTTRHHIAKVDIARLVSVFE